MNDPRDTFLEIYQSKIKRAGSEELLEWLTSSDFFTAPASTRYHGSFEGGLVTHSVNVYRCLAEELELSGLSNTYTEETVALVSLLHDVCKANFYKKGTRNVKENGQWVTKEVFEIDEKFPCGHGEKSVIILQNFIHLCSNMENLLSQICPMRFSGLPFIKQSAVSTELPRRSR